MLMEFAKFRQTVFCLEAFAFAAAQLWATHLRVVLGGIAMLIRDSHIRRLGCTCMYKRGPRCLCQYVGYCWVSFCSFNPFPSWRYQIQVLHAEVPIHQCGGFRRAWRVATHALLLPKPGWSWILRGTLHVHAAWSRHKLEDWFFWIDIVWYSISGLF